MRLLKVNNAEDKCRKRYDNACGPDPTCEACGEFYESVGTVDEPVLACTRQDPSFEAVQDACVKAGLGWALGSGRVPGLSPPAVPPDPPL